MYISLTNKKRMSYKKEKKEEGGQNFPSLHIFYGERGWGEGRSSRRSLPPAWERATPEKKGKKGKAGHFLPLFYRGGEKKGRRSVRSLCSPGNGVGRRKTSHEKRGKGKGLDFIICALRDAIGGKKGRGGKVTMGAGPDCKKISRLEKERRKDPFHFEQRRGIKRGGEGRESSRPRPLHVERGPCTREENLSVFSTREKGEDTVAVKQGDAPPRLGKKKIAKSSFMNTLRLKSNRNSGRKGSSEKKKKVSTLLRGGKRGGGPQGRFPPFRVLKRETLLPKKKGGTLSLTRKERKERQNRVYLVVHRRKKEGFAEGKGKSSVCFFFEGRRDGTLCPEPFGKKG